MGSAMSQIVSYHQIIVTITSTDADQYYRTTILKYWVLAYMLSCSGTGQTLTQYVWGSYCMLFRATNYHLVLSAQQSAPHTRPRGQKLPVLSTMTSLRVIQQSFVYVVQYPSTQTDIDLVGCTVQGMQNIGTTQSGIIQFASLESLFPPKIFSQSKRELWNTKPS